MKIHFAILLFFGVSTLSYSDVSGLVEIQRLLQGKTIPNLSSYSTSDRDRLSFEAKEIVKNRESTIYCEEAEKVLLKLGDHEVEQKTLGMFHSENRRYAQRAYFAMLRACAPNLIAQLEPDLNIKEAASERVYPGDPKASGYTAEIGSPPSVMAAMAIKNIVINSGEFPESVMSWAKALPLNEPERLRADVRHFVAQNRALLNAEQYQMTKPPTPEEKK